MDNIIFSLEFNNYENNNIEIKDIFSLENNQFSSVFYESSFIISNDLIISNKYFSDT